jgi:NMD protein affecting ribosome stability and mRNA decay
MTMPYSNGHGEPTSPGTCARCERTILDPYGAVCYPCRQARRKIGERLAELNEIAARDGWTTMMETEHTILINEWEHEL